MFNIPEEKLPKEFRDEARLDSLYSPFRSHSVNPRDWDTKISSWKNLIYLYCVNNGTYTFTLNHLNKSLMRNGRPPSCLNVVLEELVKRGDLQYLEAFVKESPKSWTGWASDLLVKKPLSWSYNTVKRTLFSNQVNADQNYVHIEVVHEEAQKLATAVTEKNKAINFFELLKLLGKNSSQIEDVKLLLQYLVKEKRVDMKYIKDGTDLKSLLIKVGYQDKPVQITEVDIAIYVLEENEKIFTKCVEDLEDEVQNCIKEVKKQLLKGHRQLAKTHLKKKHEIEKRLTHKANALHKIQVLLERIKDVRDDADVWQSYKHAVTAFNTTFKETGLSEEAIEDTMLKLGEMLEVHDDIQSSLARPIASEDEDLENELADLMKVEDEAPQNEELDDLDEQLAKLDLSNLPNIPTGNVSVQEPS